MEKSNITAKFLLTILSAVVAIAMASAAKKMERPSVQILFPDIADKDYINASFAVMTNVNPLFELHCHADYPVEWIFHYNLADDGISELYKLSTTVRHGDNFIDPTSYRFTSKLRLEYNGKLFSLVNFTCQPTDIHSKFNTHLQTHVFMREQNELSLITLQLTAKPLPTTNSVLNENENCSNAEVVMRRKENDIIPCYRCEVPETGKMLEFDYIRCLTPTQCKNTFSRETRGTECLRRQDSLVPPQCDQVFPHFNPSFIVCKNYGHVLPQFYFFGVYRGNRGDNVTPPRVYFSWAEVNTTDMLYMHPFRKKVVYTGEVVKFTCEYSRYYFSLGSWIGIQNNRGFGYKKAIDVKPCDTQVEKVQRTDNCSLGEDWRGTYTGSLSMTFDEVGPHQIFCLGPVWNSTEWINASVTFYVQESEAPIVISLQPDRKHKFVVGQVNRKLVCKVSGKPTPKIIWKGPSNESVYKTKQVDNFTSELIFIEVGLKTSGKYICIATSFVSEDSKYYQLTSHNEKLSAVAITAISVAAIIIIIVVALVIARMRGIIKTQENALRLLTEAELNEFVEGNPAILEAHRNNYFNNSTAIEALPYDEKYEIPKENLSIEYTKILGTGEYGLVLKGEIRNLGTSHYANLNYVNVDDSALEVAVKVSKGNLNVTNFKALLTEIKVMAYLGVHKNIACLVGASTKNIQNRELYIAVEYCHNGSLDTYLKKHKSEFAQAGEQGEFSIQTLLRWSVDIADGVEYMHGKKVIHADLAIRNVLLTKDLVAKVADFGLSRALNESSSYTKTTKCALPWRNMAIESLKNLEFSVKSDMWSFAVTLWEIFTLGDVPYPGMNFSMDFTGILERGLRLYKPPLASSSIYDYMLMCWSVEPSDRPGTNDLKMICLKEIN